MSWPDRDRVACWSSPGEIHVWHARVDLSYPWQRLAARLPDDERRRADGFRFDRDRGWFVARRWMLRCLLGAYTGKDPADVRFSGGRWDRPELAGDGARAGLRFNTSHSRGLVLCGITPGAAVGVDVEFVRPHDDVQQLGDRFFSAEERACLAHVRPVDRTDAFFNAWTRKEAYVKAVGLGLSLALDSFTVSLAPGEPALVREIGGSRAEAARWSLLTFDPDAGYRAAVCVETRRPVFTVRSWAGPEDVPVCAAQEQSG